MKERKNRANKVFSKEKIKTKSKSGKEAKIFEYQVDDSFFLSILRVWKHFYQKE
jgi:hypothetical protein